MMGGTPKLHMLRNMIMFSVGIRNMKSAKRSGRSSLLAGWVLALVLGCMAGTAVADDLEGQSAGNPNWCRSDVQGWKELDYIPGRVVLSGGPATGRTVTITFNHSTRSSTPEIQFLTGFSPSPNVVITAGPALSAPPGASMWSYTFTVNLLDNNPGQISFYSRLSAGAHLSGSGLIQYSSRALQIPQPGPAAGSPDLAIVKSGPATVSPGSLITCTLNYTNKLGYNAATGVQVTEILPGQLAYVPGSASGDAVLVGNTLTWDIGNLPSGAGGSVSYQAVVSTNAPAGQSLNDTAMILSAENDANRADNTLNSAITLTVTQNCQAPTIVSSPACATSCAGQAAAFSVNATGPGPLGFQWRKNGNAIPGATQSSFSVAAPCTNDVAFYDVVVTNGCGAATSTAAALGIGQPINGARMLANGTFQLDVVSLANRQYAVQFSADLIHWTNAQTGFTGGGGLTQWVDSAPTAAAQRFYRVVLLP